MLRLKPLDKKDFVTAYDVWRKIYTVHPLDLPDWLQPDALLVSIDNVKSAVKLYRKYSGAETHHSYPDTISRFREDFEGTEAWDSWIKYKNKNLWTNGSDVCHEKLLFRSWLFDYCFQDVI